MPTINLKGETLCAGGGHAGIRLTVAGNDHGLASVFWGDLQGPVTQEDKDNLVTLLIRLKLLDLTPAQIKSAIGSAPGVTVTI